MFYTYVLRSLKNGRLYVGSAENLSRRIIEHNSGKTKATRYIRPLELVYFEKFRTRSQAIQREKALKSGQGRAWLKKKLG